MVHRKIWIGGLGALTPIILNLLVVDIGGVLSSATLTVVIGFIVRVVLLFGVGGFVAYLHKTEHDPLKLFELGISAPALLLTLANGTIAKPNSQPTAFHQNEGWGLVTTVWAAQPPPADSARPHFGGTLATHYFGTADSATLGDTAGSGSGTALEVKQFPAPQESRMSQFFRGLFGGRAPRKDWYVAAGSYPDAASARRQAAWLKATRPGMTVEVYAPYEDMKGYSVVLGANLTYSEASKLLDDAVAEKIPLQLQVKQLSDDR